MDSETVNATPTTSSAELDQQVQILLVGVLPITASSGIEEKLSELNVKPIEQITDLRVPISVSDCSHLYYIFKKMYVKPEDVNKLPDTSLQINHNKKVYPIDLIRRQQCYLCKNEEHIVDNCKNREYHMQISNMQPQEKPKQKNTVYNNDIQGSPLPRTTKRSLPSTSADLATRSINAGNKKESKIRATVQDRKKVNTQNKKPLTIREIEEMLAPARDNIIQQSQTYPMNFGELVKFISEAQNSSPTRLLCTIIKYMVNISVLTNMLGKIHKLLQLDSRRQLIATIRKRIQQKFPRSDSAVSDNESSSEDENL